MPNTHVPAAASGSPKISRRALVAGLAASATAPAIALAAVAEHPGARIAELADEISHLMARAGLGEFFIRISPARDGVAHHAIQQLKLPAKARLTGALVAANEALQELQPGAWRIVQDVENGVVVFVDGNRGNAAMGRDDMIDRVEEKA